MRLTQYTDFSIRVLIYLGLNPERRCTIQEIAEGYAISRNHLMKVVQQLAQAGYVESTRGSGGGLRLGHAPEQINLAEVIEEMEPDLSLVECFRDNNQCVITPACRLPPMLVRATRAFLDVLREHTLADLLGEQDAADMRVMLRLVDD
ncbi:MAG: Rrf2 family transcriptional regulator [Wenzhouxiangellaceae bacterium]|nr:Rrf2 family transcriptional regulator [Wenzhouxiangellaceae bacterium]